jgi:hypothetical protein
VIGLKPSAALLCAILVTGAEACPFCDVVGRPLAARRDAASVVVIAEPAGDPRDDGGAMLQSFAVHSVLRGQGMAAGEVATARVTGRADGTALLFGERDGAEGHSFEAVAADEMLLAYVAGAPAVEAAGPERLRWFARYLEHADRLIAEDAFMEFGLAPYGDVVRAADALDGEKLRHWVDEPGIDERRRGFYGLALGIVAARTRNAGDMIEADACVEVLDRAIRKPANDFRSGYDGLLGGLLVAKGEAALHTMATLGLLDDDTRAGDARHALAALRFAHEFLAETVPRGQVAAAVARLATNPAVAADAVIDLARYGHWESTEAVADLWDTLGRDDPLVRRAVAGYLTACPLGPARGRAAAIAARDPAAWHAAVSAVGLPARKAD